MGQEILDRLASLDGVGERFISELETKDAERQYTQRKALAARLAKLEANHVKQVTALQAAEGAAASEFRKVERECRPRINHAAASLRHSRDHIASVDHSHNQERGKIVAQLRQSAPSILGEYRQRLLILFDENRDFDVAEAEEDSGFHNGERILKRYFSNFRSAARRLAAIGDARNRVDAMTLEAIDPSELPRVLEQLVASLPKIEMECVLDELAEMEEAKNEP